MSKSTYGKPFHRRWQIKKMHELRSGPYTVTNKVTNVNYEIQLDSD